MDRRQTGGRRREDRVARRWERAKAIWRDLVPALALGIAAWAVLISQGTVNDLEREADHRTDGQCTIFEGQHLDEVETLGRTYSYFLTVEPEDRDDPIFVFAVRQLPMIEARAYADPAPRYCDEPNVGLPEPDPEVPERPKGLTDTLKLPPTPQRPD